MKITVRIRIVIKKEICFLHLVQNKYYKYSNRFSLILLDSTRSSKCEYAKN